MFVKLKVLLFFVILKSNVSNQTNFQTIANITYSKVLPCILDAWIMKNNEARTFAFPDDAEEHFQFLKDRTARFRTAPVHDYANYQGPWIENIFISRYLDSSVYRFNGLIPLFIQWIDNQILRRHYFDDINNELRQILRPNVLYLAVSQGDIGLGKIGVSLPNILVLSAGGFGHVPIPLIRGEIPWKPLPDGFQQMIGFFGSIRQGSRVDMLSQIKKLSESLNVPYKHGSGNSWQSDMEHTKFNLAPRGYGRSSFRFAESVQMGRIPVFLYDDIGWIPYLNSTISIEKYGFSAGLTKTQNTLPQLVHALNNVTQEEFEQKMENLKQVRKYFTYDGVFEMFDLFLHDPFGKKGGALRCIRHPMTERCCDQERFKELIMSNHNDILLIRHHKEKQVYLIQNNTRHHVPNMDVFQKYRFSFDNVKVTMDMNEINEIPLGEDLA